MVDEIKSQLLCQLRYAPATLMKFTIGNLRIHCPVLPQSLRAITRKTGQ
jgi:hypothetical protein